MLETLCQENIKGIETEQTGDARERERERETERQRDRDREIEIDR